MDLYQSLVNMQVRKNARQKSEFIEYVRSLAEEKGYSFSVEESGSLPKTRNIVIGDPETAEVVFAGHYDTCAKMPFPNLLTPRNPLTFLGWQMLLVIPMVGIPVATMLLLQAAGVNRFLTLGIYMLMLFAEFYLMMMGPANKHTMNDNTSGVYTVLTAMLAGDPAKKAAYVLFDNEELGLVGSGAFAKAHPRIKKDVPVFNFDCVGDGEHMLLFPKKAAKNHPAYEQYQAALEGAPFAVVPCDSGFAVYPSDQKKFDLGIGVACFHRNPRVGYVMGRIHTGRDTVLNREHADALANAIVKYTENL